MKNLFNKIICTLASVAFLGLLTGCNPEEEMKQFSVAFKEAGPGYVTLVVTVPAATTVSHILATGTPYPDVLTAPTQLNIRGNKTVFYSDGEHQILNYDIKENEKYYLYLVANLPGNNLSDTYTFEFETGEFTFNQLATVVGVGSDGYKMRITVPESVRTSEPGTPGSRAIRYAQSCLMQYNYSRKSNDDYFHTLYNAGDHVTKDTIIEYSDELNKGQTGADTNEDGVVDENDMGILWNPIAPGEPVVFIAAEYEWMQEPEDMDSENNYVVNGFTYPAGWKPGYYLPCLDSERYWSYYDPSSGKTDSEPSTKVTGVLKDFDLSSDIDGMWEGAFQRKIFRTKVPPVLDASIKVEVSDLRSVDATISIIPDSKIVRYLFSILDQATYNQMLELLDGHEEYLQWAVTSYFAMWNFGATEIVADGDDPAPAVDINLTDYFYDVPSETTYYVLVTGMSGSIGSPQCFYKHEFRTPAKTKTVGPEIVVKALDDYEVMEQYGEIDPFTAYFNIKCTTGNTDNRVDRCYYGANYYKDWVLGVNGGSSYETLGQSASFTEDEIDQINSPEGLTISIPSIDGETTRLVVVGYNDENVSNGVDEWEDILLCPAVADYKTPYFEAEELVASDLLRKGTLDGDWTLTANVIADTLHTVVSQKSKVSIRSRLKEGVDYPSVLPDSVRTIYKEETKWTDTQINGYFSEFKSLAAEFNEKRLAGQNKILLQGWLDNDTMGRLALMTPWDLFISRKISMVDVASMFSEFGPKMYFEVDKTNDGRDTLTITADRYFASPVLNWSVPFYMAGYADQETNNTVFEYTKNGYYSAPLKFPVELSEDLNTIKIKPFESNGLTWYPNVIGIDSQTRQYILQYPIISEVVLTRGWDADAEAAPAAAPLTRSGARMSYHGVAPVKELNAPVHKGRTILRKQEGRRQIDGNVITMDKLRENLENYSKKHFNVNR